MFLIILSLSGNEWRYYDSAKIKSLNETGTHLREARRSQGISQEQLAGVAGTGVRFISELENGKERIQLAKVLKVVEVLGLEMYIFNRREKE